MQRAGRLKGGKAGYHCARAGEQGAGEGDTADFVRGGGAAYSNGAAESAKDEMVDGDDEQ